ncbi:MAG TPA: hypothetical protein VG426_09940 [Candidatus Dormibacteraeota bacterium]|jgi:hypothetical protein|nr:hypothetical protein [Candidatus Dormibacteraeota bacterium]
MSRDRWYTLATLAVLLVWSLGMVAIGWTVYMVIVLGFIGLWFAVSWWRKRGARS